MKWIKRLLWVIATALIFAAGISLYSYHLSRGTPAWYLPRLTQAEQAAAVTSATQKFADALSYAGDIAAARQRHATPRGASRPMDLIGPKTISISQSEINSFFAKWDQPQTSAISARVSNYVSDAGLALADDRLVVVGTLKNVGMASDTLASIEFAPSVDDQGRVWLKLDQIYGGRLPLPRSLFAPQEDKIRKALQNDLPGWQEKAEQDADGTTNRFAVEAQLAKLLLASLDDTYADPTFFLPKIGDKHRSIPVRLTAVKVADKTLTLTIRPLSDEEMKQVLPMIQQPYAAPDGTQMGS